MGTNKVNLKFTALLIVFFTTSLYSQAEYVPFSHPVYDFLQRMDALHLVSNFNSLERPLPRKQIAGYIKETIENQGSLSEVDRGILNDLKSEFELELFGTQNNATSLFGSNDYNFFSPKEKFLYKMADSSKMTLFVNVLGDVETIAERNLGNERNYTAMFARWGGTIRGTILDKFGFYMRGTNGHFSGERSIAGLINELKFNYKFNSSPEAVTATDYFDNSEGYLTADFDLIRFKIGRDQQQIGYGPFKNILDVNTPQFDYLAFDINYKILSFSYFHGKLLGNASYRSDTVQGFQTTVDEKYIGYHRLGFNVLRDFTFGLGEMIVYSNRSLDLSYLNPFNFYKSTEHSNQDRDNSLLFLDFTNNTLRGLKLFATVLIDDIDFGKIGTGWYGNQLCYNFSVFSSNLYEVAPIDIRMQYLRVEPYVYTHRILDNGYSNFGYSLVSPVLPNSDLFYIGLSYHPHFRMNFNLDFMFGRHGANELNPDGTIKKNTGGDPGVGYRTTDSQTVYFLEGTREYQRRLTFSGVFEPVKNYFITGKLIFENSTIQNELNHHLVFYLLLNLRI